MNAARSKPRHAGARLPVMFGTVFVFTALLSTAHGRPSPPNSPGKTTAAPAGAAAGASAGDEPTTMLGSVRVIGQRVTDPADVPYSTPGSSAYISGEQIERFRGTSVGDFLSGIPGVMNADSRNSGAVDVNIRGMQGQGRVPVIVDGATQETTIWQGYNGASPRTYIDPDFISSVSIEKGISSGADATGATGGIVRARTLIPKDILVPGKQFGIRLKGGFNTNSSSAPAAGTDGGWNTRRAAYYHKLPSADSQFATTGMNRPSLLDPTGASSSMAIAGTYDYIDFVAAYAQRHNGNYHAGTHGRGGARLIADRDPEGTRVAFDNTGLTPYREGEEILNTSYDNKSWMLKAIIKPGVGQTLTLGYTKYISDYGHLMSSRLVSMPYQSWLSSIDLDTYTAQYRLRPEGNDLIDLKINAYVSAVDNRINVLDLVRRRSMLTPDAPPTKRYFPILSWIGSTRTGVTASNTSVLPTSHGNVTLEYGGGFVREDVGLPSGVDFDWYTNGQDYPREGRRDEYSAFTAFKWKPYDWLSVDGSARYSRFMTIDRHRSLAAPFERSDSGWSPQAGLTFEPVTGLQVYGKIGRAVRAASTFESVTGPSFYYPVESNPVKLERARNIEVGVNYLKNGVFNLADKIRFHAAYFDNHIDDFLTRAGVWREIPVGSGWYVETLGRINLDYAKMRGVEVSAEYDAGRYFGSIAVNHYTHVMFCAPAHLISPAGPDCSPGGLPHSYTLQQVPPKHTVTVNLGARFLEKKLLLGSRIRYIGSRYSPGVRVNIGAGGMEPSAWRPYTLVDVHATYKHSDHVSFNVAVDNITDRFYADALNAASMPAPGRTIHGSMTIKF
ncbi:TonB-dependent receptor domain-containing protein [Paracandidimonas lactea]|uniref:TonB-dependent receptor domain-containing protein n=1 Tax=Paracandidimonas lactea TaxID=2895524 RepID=UPI001F45D2B1|nr:TonB-dependent receptor [Paracandidimonas lactea]